MSDPTPITVKPPKLAGATVGTATRIDRAVVLSLGPVTLPDGSALAADASAGGFLYRVTDKGEEIWNEQANAWQASPPETELGASLQGLPLAYAPAAGRAWQSTINATMQFDAAGAPRFGIAVTENPKYFARALVSATRSDVQYRGLSGPSPMLGFASVASVALPAPQLAWKGGALPPIEKPVTVALPELTLPSGARVVAEDAIKVGAFVYRVDGALWNEKDQQWQAPPAGLEPLAELTPLVLSYQAGKPLPWEGTLTAAGQVDKDGAPRFLAVNDGGAPYTVRAFAQVRKDGVVYLGLGPASLPLPFVKTAGEERFKIEFDTDGAQDCTKATLRLRDATGAQSAFLHFDAVARSAELATCDAAGNPRASVRITPAGDIELAPAPGRRVIVFSDIETGRIRYQPSGGGGKLDL